MSSITPASTPEQPAKDPAVTPPPDTGTPWHAMDMAEVIRVRKADSENGLTDAAVADITRRLGTPFGETSADGRFSLCEATCLGACGDGPVMQVDDESPVRLDRDAIDRLVDEFA